MPENGRGKLKIFMGYAAGVGKTYKMLEEAQELKSKGLDVVVGYFEPHNRIDTIAKTEGLELVPRKRMTYRDSPFEEMDIDAIPARRPHTATCRIGPGQTLGRRAVVVGRRHRRAHHYEHSAPGEHGTSPGFGFVRRFQIGLVQQAYEVVMIDLTPRALLHRLERGVVYGSEKAKQAMQNFFRESTLVALRELALRQAAHEVEHRMVESARANIQKDEFIPRNISTRESWCM